MTGTGLTSTLRDLLGAPIAEVTAQDIARLIDGQVKETDELDFKAMLYGKDEDAKVELPQRVQLGGAALAGTRPKVAAARPPDLYSRSSG